MQFEALPLSPEVLQAVEQCNFTEMTEIQEKAIPFSSAERTSSENPIPEPEKQLLSVSRLLSKLIEMHAILYAHSSSALHENLPCRLVRKFRSFLALKSG